jgi:hypothetical protein
VVVVGVIILSGVERIPVYLINKPIHRGITIISGAKEIPLPNSKHRFMAKCATSIASGVEEISVPNSRTRAIAVKTLHLHAPSNAFSAEEIPVPNLKH